MLKKIALVLLFALPVGAFAQTFKFGHMKFSEIVTVMPEYIKAQSDLQALQKQYASEIKRTQDEFNKKYAEFIAAKDTLPQNISERRQKELQDMAQRGQEYEQEAQAQLQKAQEEKTAPIFKKLEDAITAVGQAEGFTYIFDVSNKTIIPFVNEKTSIDATPAIKAKLGIK
ncbi:OmpH family outer membrane protein [Bacteroides sedimenti]|uniref:Membrane protein n=1 Tax=Bacteroides sedimenti TaxID=2136147 RepID=A0ABN6Z5J3_9BACE